MCAMRVDTALLLLCIDIRAKVRERSHVSAILMHYCNDDEEIFESVGLEYPQVYVDLQFLLRYVTYKSDTRMTRML